MKIRIPSFVRLFKTLPGTVRCQPALQPADSRRSAPSHGGRRCLCSLGILAVVVLAVGLASCGPSRRGRRPSTESEPAAGAGQPSSVATVPTLSSAAGPIRPTEALAPRTPQTAGGAPASSVAQQTRAPEITTASVDASGSSGGMASSGSVDTLGRLIIPTIGVDVPIADVSWHLVHIDGETVGQWDALPGVAGHHVGTAPPGGEGNCVISGHSRAEDGAVLARIEELEPGDEIVLVALDGRDHRYTVKQVHKLAELGASLSQRRENAAHMSATDDARLTLITCWPDWAYTHRLVVVASRS